MIRICICRKVALATSQKARNSAFSHRQIRVKVCAPALQRDCGGNHGADISPAAHSAREGSSAFPAALCVSRAMPSARETLRRRA